MTAGVEVNRVRQVFALYGILGGDIDVLAPGSRADEDDALGIIGPNGCHHCLGVRLEIGGPAHLAVGFVHDLVEDVRVLAVLA